MVGSSNCASKEEAAFPAMFEDVRVHTKSEGYAVVELARPKRSNAFTDNTLAELTEAFRLLDRQADAKAIVLTGEGRNFCAGIDLQSLEAVAELMTLGDTAQAAAAFRRRILKMQEPFDAIEACRWPVIAAIQGACIGGGLDLAAACDIRCCSEDARFSIKEVDLAITADLGSLQRLPHIIGTGATTELALTARLFDSHEAKTLGLVSHVLPDRESLMRSTAALATQLASKSPGALIGTKRVLQHARDSSVRDGLEYVATWNGGQALSFDLTNTLAAAKRRAPSKL